MGSRSKKNLMMVNDENYCQAKETDTNSKRSFREGDVGHKKAAITIKNSSMASYFRFVFAMYYYTVNTLPIKSIIHKFLIRGHTQNKADAVHSVIEKNVKRAKKAGPIYTPAEYISLIKNAKKKGVQFTVTEMNFDSFIEMKMLSEDVNLNVNKDVDGNTFKILDTKAIKFTKDSEIFQFKCSYKSDKWTAARIRTGRNGNKKNVTDITLNQVYNEKLPIPNRKKEDIRQLISSNIVPKFYEQYFNNLF